ncbi:kinetochore-associated protein KNL-2 homolog [Vicia villosa]|uniref:kinetochore-associated protein KNL-2 homolog n=1 Tax=Vicia villosa TaxID=3911 RepID=UPI00273C2ED7|nr:kinetochore-associated protein KNL-2 homolog [Vicia villosa]
MASNTPMRSNSTPLSNSIFKSKPVFLHEWWLVKPLNHCNGFALAGIASMPGEKMFVSSVIVKVHEPNVVETDDGTIVGFRGFINSSRTLQNGFPSQICQRFSIGFPHDWKKLSARLGNGCDYVDRVNGFDVLNTSCHKETTDDTSQEAMEAERNKNVTSLKLSQPQVDVIFNGENGFSNVDDSNAFPCRKIADQTLQEAEGNDNITSHKLSHPPVEEAYNGGNKVSDFDDLNASILKKTADATSHKANEAEDEDNNGSLRMSQPQVDVINNGENGVSSVVAPESSQSKMDAFEFDHVLEQSRVKSPLNLKKLKLSSDRKKNKRLKQKIIENSDNSFRRVTRSIAKNSHIML